MGNRPHSAGHFAAVRAAGSEGHAWSRKPERDIAVALVLVVLISTLLSMMHRHLPSSLVVQPGYFFPRPGNLVPAAFFLLAALAYHRRLKTASVPFDRSQSCSKGPTSRLISNYLLFLRGTEGSNQVGLLGGGSQEWVFRIDKQGNLHRTFKDNCLFGVFPN
jgi:hypothetical protein